MAGDEAVNPTPEPLPAGLEEWPEAEGWGTGASQAGAATTWDDQPETASDDALDWPAGDEARDLGTPVAFDAEEAELRATGEYPAVDSDLLADRDFTDDFPAGFDAVGLDEDDEFELSEDIFLFDDDVGPEADAAGELPGLDEPLPPERLFDQSRAEDDLDDLAEELLFLSEDPEGGLDGPEPALHLDDDPEDEFALIDDLAVAE